ncbi:hypothetical protein GT204_07745 [Streptomyces sp. SID4919]|nr:hypothetical protein [Streptomyces sp. SID4919]
MRTGVIARQLDAIAPGTVTVRTVPIQTDAGGTPRRATWVYLLTADGQPVGADQEQHRAARGWLRRMLPHADWSRPQRYDASTGVLRDDSPEMPEELHA